MKKFINRRLISGLCASSLLSFSVQAMASAFQLWEQDGASVGNYHAGYAAEANNASIAFYNPAGITLIKNPQIVVGGIGVLTSFKYRGTIGINSVAIDGVVAAPQTVTAQGGVSAVIPDFHFVIPINNCLGFGFSVDTPFGSEVNYGRKTILRYASTLASIKVIDISPALGIQLTDQASIGFGPDFQKMNTEFDQVAILGDPITDTDSINKADDTGWGFHAGGLYQITPDARIGLSYHSQVVHHLSRKSTFTGFIADEINNGPIVSRATANITLPPYTALSFYDRINPKFSIMSSIIYTQWNIVREVIMKNVAGILHTDPTTELEVIIPTKFRNTWNISIGGNYYATDQITLKAGLGYDQTPVQSAYRNVQLPDNNHYVIALGGHYQACKSVGLDLGWMHVFIGEAVVHPPTQVTGDQEVTTNGNVTGGADVYGAQITWDIV